MALSHENDVAPTVGAILVEDVLPRADACGTHRLELGVLPFAEDDPVGEALIIRPSVTVAGRTNALELARQALIVHQSQPEVFQEVRAVLVAEVVALNVAIGREHPNELRRDAPKPTLGFVDPDAMVREHRLCVWISRRSRWRSRPGPAHRQQDKDGGSFPHVDRKGRRECGLGAVVERREPTSDGRGTRLQSHAAAAGGLLRRCPNRAVIHPSGGCQLLKGDRRHGARFEADERELE
jgi:hypothetical protein